IRRTKVGRRSWGDIGAKKCFVLIDLLFQFRQRRLISVDLELLEQLLDARQVARAVRHVLLEVVLERPAQLRVAETRARVRHRLTRQRCRPRLQASIFSQPNERLRTSVGRYALVDQAAKSLQQKLRKVEGGQ